MPHSTTVVVLSHGNPLAKQVILRQSNGWGGVQLSEMCWAANLSIAWVGVDCSTLVGLILKSWGPFKRNYRKAHCLLRNYLTLYAVCWPICWRRLPPVTFNTASL